MGYYDKPVNREDKAGANRTNHYESGDQELNQAKRTDMYGDSSAPNADELGYLGMDDLDRLRREKLKHETR